jgi:hypothetical protein
LARCSIGGEIQLTVSVHSRCHGLHEAENPDKQRYEYSQCIVLRCRRGVFRVVTFFPFSSVHRKAQWKPTISA